MALAGIKSAIANVLLVLATSIAVILVFEVGLRLWEPTSDVQVLTEMKTAQGSYLALKPAVHGLVLGRPVTVNAEGYRGVPLPQHKSSGVIRILFLGDSHTFSMGADDEHTYPVIVGRQLNANGLRCEVLNFGVPGQDLRQYLLLLGDRALQYEPDIIVITFHDGDILESPDDLTPEAPSPANGRLYHVKVWALEHSYVARLVIPYGAAFVRRAFGWNPGVISAEQREIEQDGKTWRVLQARLLDLKRELDGRGVILAFALFPNMLPFDTHPARGEHKALAGWLDRHGIPTVDLLPAFDGQQAATLTASLLDKHPNEKGYAIAGHAAAAFLADLINEREHRGTQSVQPRPVLEKKRP